MNIVKEPVVVIKRKTKPVAKAGAASGESNGAVHSSELAYPETTHTPLDSLDMSQSISLADLPQSDKDKLSRLVSNFVALGHENEELKVALEAEKLRCENEIQARNQSLHIHLESFEAKEKELAEQLSAEQQRSSMALSLLRLYQESLVNVIGRVGTLNDGSNVTTRDLDLLAPNRKCESAEVSTQTIDTVATQPSISEKAATATIEALKDENMRLEGLLSSQRLTIETLEAARGQVQNDLLGLLEREKVYSERENNLIEREKGLVEKVSMLQTEVIALKQANSQYESRLRVLQEERRPTGTTNNGDGGLSSSSIAAGASSAGGEVSSSSLGSTRELEGRYSSLQSSHEELQLKCEGMEQACVGMARQLSEAKRQLQEKERKYVELEVTVKRLQELLVVEKKRQEVAEVTREVSGTTETFLQQQQQMLLELQRQVHVQTHAHIHNRNNGYFATGVGTGTGKRESPKRTSGTGIAPVEARLPWSSTSPWRRNGNGSQEREKHQKQQQLSQRWSSSSNDNSPVKAPSFIFPKTIFSPDLHPNPNPNLYSHPDAGADADAGDDDGDDGENNDNFRKNTFVRSPEHTSSGRKLAKKPSTAVAREIAEISRSFDSLLNPTPTKRQQKSSEEGDRSATGADADSGTATATGIPVFRSLDLDARSGTLYGDHRASFHTTTSTSPSSAIGYGIDDTPAVALNKGVNPELTRSPKRSKAGTHKTGASARHDVDDGTPVTSPSRARQKASPASKKSPSRASALRDSQDSSSSRDRLVSPVSKKSPSRASALRDSQDSSNSATKSKQPRISPKKTPRPSVFPQSPEKPLPTGTMTKTTSGTMAKSSPGRVHRDREVADHVHVTGRSPQTTSPARHSHASTTASSTGTASATAATSNRKSPTPTRRSSPKTKKTMTKAAGVVFPEAPISARKVKAMQKFFFEDSAVEMSDTSLRASVESNGSSGVGGGTVAKNLLASSPFSSSSMGFRKPNSFALIEDYEGLVIDDDGDNDDVGVKTDNKPLLTSSIQSVEDNHQSSSLEFNTQWNSATSAAILLPTSTSTTSTSSSVEATDEPQTSIEKSSTAGEESQTDHRKPSTDFGAAGTMAYISLSDSGVGDASVDADSTSTTQNSDPRAGKKSGGTDKRTHTGPRDGGLSGAVGGSSTTTASAKKGKKKKKIVWASDVDFKACLPPSPAPPSADASPSFDRSVLTGDDGSVSGDDAMETDKKPIAASISMLDRLEGWEGGYTSLSHAHGWMDGDGDNDGSGTESDNEEGEGVGSNGLLGKKPTTMVMKKINKSSTTKKVKTKAVKSKVKKVKRINSSLELESGDDTHFKEEDEERASEFHHDSDSDSDDDGEGRALVKDLLATSSAGKVRAKGSTTDTKVGASTNASSSTSPTRRRVSTSTTNSSSASKSILKHTKEPANAQLNTRAGRTVSSAPSMSSGTKPPTSIAKASKTSGTNLKSVSLLTGAPVAAEIARLPSRTGTHKPSDQLTVSRTSNGLLSSSSTRPAARTFTGSTDNAKQTTRRAAPQTTHNNVASPQRVHRARQFLNGDDAYAGLGLGSDLDVSFGYDAQKFFGGGGGSSAKRSDSRREARPTVYDDSLFDLLDQLEG